MPGEKLALGVDLGGTKIEVAVLREAPPSFAFELRDRVPTYQEAGYEAILERTADLIERAARSAGLLLDRTPIGVGMPGSVARSTGLVKNSNTTCLNGRPFRQDLCRRLGRAVAFDNDATCFALAEARYGAGRQHADGLVFGVILGTGVGGGLVFRGEPWSGLQGIAGEWGHHAVRSDGPEARACYCGQRGCLERYASGPAVEETYRDLGGVEASLREIAERRGEDANAERAIESLVNAFGRGLANVIDILDPTAVVLGGGVSNLSLLYDEGRARVARYVFNDELLTPILKNELGDSAGVVGAALLGMDPKGPFHRPPSGALC